MSAFPSLCSESVIVRKLRAAGCVFAEDEARLLISAAPTPADLTAMVDRRVAGLPLEHVLGWAEFCDLRVAVDPGVFVPRRRTEFLVRQAAALIDRAAPPADQPADQPATQPAGKGSASVRLATNPTWADPVGPRIVVVDLCCGSGAVGLALVAALHPVELHAVDIEPAAVRCARRNVAAAGGRVYEGDLYDPLPTTLRGRVDVLVANAPYVPTGAIALMPPEARLHGADGRDVLRRVTAAAPLWLAPGGHLLVETSERQAARTVETFASSGLIPRVASCAELNATVVIGTRPAIQSRQNNG